jgi:hypothetical protein
LRFGAKLRSHAEFEEKILDPVVRMRIEKELSVYALMFSE